MDTKRILKIIIILSFLGLITSLYLVLNHYAPPESGSVCDFSKSISCTVATSSQFGEFLGIPVSIFGVLWFVILYLMTWKVTKGKEKHIYPLLLWSVIGFISVIYFVTAEIILKALCPFCTVVHVIVVIVLIYSIILQKRYNPKLLVSAVKPWLISVIVVSLILVAAFNWPVQEKLDGLAKCMNEKGVVLYSSIHCGYCMKAKEMFGGAYQYLNVVECSRDGPNSQTEFCVEKKLDGFPTWIIEQDGKEIKRQSGFLTIDELKKFSGCE